MAGRYQSYQQYKPGHHVLIGNVPETWASSKLGYCLSAVVAGGTPASSDDTFWTDTGTGVPWVSIADITASDGSVSVTKKDVTPKGIAEKQLRILPAGTLLYSIFASLGKVSKAGVPLTTNQAILGLIPEKRIDLDYLAYALRALEPILSYFASSNTQDNLNAEKVRGLPVCYPTVLEEQKTIARFLDHETAKIDELIAKQERLIELLKEKRQAVISHAVTKGLNPDVPMKESGVEWLGEVPEHWVILKAKRIFRLTCVPAPKNNDFELLSVYTDIGVKPRKELEQKGNKATTTDGYWLVNKGDLIVNKLLAWMGAVGYSDYEGVTSPAYDILRPIGAIESKFYHYLFRTKQTQSEFKRWSRGIMEMRLRLYFDELGNIPMPVPPIEEQRAIVEAIETEDLLVNKTISKAQSAVELLKERRTALISAAVTGKIDVRNWKPDDNQ